MIEWLIQFSIRQRLLIVFASLIVLLVGLRCLVLLPIDAVPDVTNRQVQINAEATALGAEDMERRVTFPLELALAGLPRLEEVRSISQFGLSQVTVVFEEEVDIYWARQLVSERLQEVRSQLPPGIELDLAPISTGLGEILYLRLDNPKLSLMEKRSLLDWVVRPQLLAIKGLAEVNTWGGTVRQFQVQVDPIKLKSYDLTFRDVIEAVAQSNDNAGGGYISRGSEQQTVRTLGLIRDRKDLSATVVTASKGVAITLGQLGQVVEGASPRQGAMTRDGQGEEAYAITMLLMGENGSQIVASVKERLPQIESSLPLGTHLVPFLDRSQLIQRTLQTASRNLIEGGVLVVVLLLLFLGQLRAGLIVSSAIPLSMLIAIAAMYRYGVSANLMSLGAIDFGLIVDGAVIIVENCVRRLGIKRRRVGRPLSQEERVEVITAATVEVRSATQFGELIIIASYLPILSLEGLEGKMFRPMGLTVVFALTGALILSFTLIPALCTLFLKEGPDHQSVGLRWLTRRYQGLLEACLNRGKLVLTLSLTLLILCGVLTSRLGGDFIPELDEGSLAVQATYLPGSTLEAVIQRTLTLEREILQSFPNEISGVASRIGRPEIATDPMQVFQVDTLVTLKPQNLWTQAHTQPQLSQALSQHLEDLPGVSLSFSQPIKMRMLELIEGVGIRSDLGLKLFGPSPTVLKDKAQQIAQIIQQVPGAQDVGVETTTGLPQLDLEIVRSQAARFGVRVDDINQIVQAALGGQQVTQVSDGSQRIDVTVMLLPELRSQSSQIAQLQVPSQGGLVPLSSLCQFVERNGPAQISRENGQRRIVIQANVSGRDLASFVEEVKSKVAREVKLPSGYYVSYGGTYQKMQSGRARLGLIMPFTFLLILTLLFLSFGNLVEALLVFIGVPLAACGGVLALVARGMTLSTSAIIGFIALAGVAVLNGVVMLHFIRHLNSQEHSPREAAVEGACDRLRPVLMTAAVAGFGFIPMALSNGAGAEVQKPLATVVIGGLISSSLLTLIVLPVAWYHWKKRR